MGKRTEDPVAGPAAGVADAPDDATAAAHGTNPDGEGGRPPGEAGAPGASAGADERAAQEEARAEGPVADPEELRARLDDALRDAEAQREAAMRARAELENVRKRAERELENAHRYALERFVGEILPVKDSMELGVAAASNQDADLASMREGVELTLKLLSSALEKFGVRELEPTGEPFDPQYHEAMSMRETDGTEAGTVITVFQKGYLLNDRLVRPAKVVVAR